jgi:hypothetical protein
MAATLVERFCFPTTELSGLPTMPEYRTYFRDSDGKIKGTQILDCEDDTAAAVKLEILLAERLNCMSAEVWEGRRLIHRTTREGTAR